MKTRTIIYLLILTMLAISGSASAIEPVAVSPGSDPSTTLRAVIGQGCPTFSWSSMEGAVAYRVEVFEALTADLQTYEDMEAMAEPLLSKEIPAPALSWTPSSGECLSTGGSYVWYVQGTDSGTGHPEPVEGEPVEGELVGPELVEGWSQGSVFEVDVSVSLAGMEEAVEGTVNEYLTNEWSSTESYREVKKEIKAEVLSDVEVSGTSGGLSIMAAVEGDAQFNTYYGTGAGASLDGTGTDNAFFGVNAGASTTGGDYNTFLGRGAGYNNTTGGWNTFLGMDAGYANTTGYWNTFIGRDAGLSNTTGNSNTFLGREAGYSNTTGFNNIFLGVNAGYYHTTGWHNTFLGSYAGYANTTGNSNTFLGRATGGNTTTGTNNTFIGVNAGYSNTTGGFNTFIGRDAGSWNTTGSNNTIIGPYAGLSNTTGAGNVFIGMYAGYNETGSNRLYIDNSNTTTPLIYGEFDNDTVTINGNLEVIGPDNGLVRLSNVTTDSTTKVSRMVLRHYTNTELPVYLFGSASTATDNFVAFGGGSAIGNAATQLDLFTAANTTTPVGTPRLTIIGNGNVGIGTQIPSYPLEMASGARVTAGGVWTNASSRQYKENIHALTVDKAMNALKELNPVTFNYKTDKGEDHVGFIAEDVPDIVATKDRKGLSSMDIVAVLTRVVKEQQKTIEEQKETFEQQISILMEELKELKRELRFSVTVGSIK